MYTNMKNYIFEDINVRFCTIEKNAVDYLSIKVLIKPIVGEIYNPL